MKVYKRMLKQLDVPVHPHKHRMENNPPWYENLYKQFPSRPRKRGKEKGRVESLVKRQDIIKILRRLAAGDETESVYADSLMRLAARME